MTFRSRFHSLKYSPGALTSIRKKNPSENRGISAVRFLWTWWLIRWSCPPAKEKERMMRERERMMRDRVRWREWRERMMRDRVRMTVEDRVRWRERENKERERECLQVNFVECIKKNIILTLPKEWLKRLPLAVFRFPLPKYTARD